MNKLLALIVISMLASVAVSLAGYQGRSELVAMSKVQATIDRPTECPTVAQLNAIDWSQCRGDQECDQMYFDTFGLDVEHCEYQD